MMTRTEIRRLAIVALERGPISAHETQDLARWILAEIGYPPDCRPCHAGLHADCDECNAARPCACLGRAAGPLLYPARTRSTP